MNPKEGINMADDKIMAFDTLYTNNQIQMYKIILPYLTPKMQHIMAILIKYMELRYAIDFHNYSICNPYKEHDFDIVKICDDFLPYCTKSQQEMMKNIRNILQSMESAKEMMATFEMMQELFPEGFSFDNENSDGFHPDGMMDMFQMFQSMNNPIS